MKVELRNKYYILRHGEAQSNIKGIFSSWPEKFVNPLTENGRGQIRETIQKIKTKKIGIQIIFASDVLRTRQTADMVAKALKLAPRFDKRLREIGFGIYNGKPAEELLYSTLTKEKAGAFKGGETYGDVLRRTYKFLREVDKKYKDKTILIVSHQCPLWILENRVDGYTLAHGVQNVPKENRIKRGELRELN